MTVTVTVSDVWKDISTAPKDGTLILVKDGVDAIYEVYLAVWTDDVYTFQGGKGGPSGWFSHNYYDRWGDQPQMECPLLWAEIPT